MMKKVKKKNYMNNIDDYAFFMVGKRTTYGRENKANNRIFTHVYFNLALKLLLGWRRFLSITKNEIKLKLKKTETNNETCSFG